MRSLPTRFERGGYVVLGESLHTSEEFRAIVDCGPLGYNRIAGHGHADALAVQVSWGAVQMLVDPGTYCYNAAPDLRHFFRGTHAHNTLVVDDCDQSEYGASFLWLRDVSCTVVSDDSTTDRAVDKSRDSIHASHDGYSRLADPVIHHRRVTLRDDGALLVDDWIDCTQAHRVELLWHAPVGSTLVRESDGAWLLTVGDRTLRMTLEYPGAGTAMGRAGGMELPEAAGQAGGTGRAGAAGLAGATGQAGVGGRGGRSVVQPFEASVIEGRESPPQGWVSNRFYQRAPAPVLSARGMLGPGQTLRTIIERRSAR